MLIVDFYSNWYGCQPLLGTQNHPGPKVHTGTRRHIVRNVKGAQLAKASCQVHSSSSYIRLCSCLLWIFCDIWWPLGCEDSHAPQERRERPRRRPLSSGNVWPSEDHRQNVVAKAEELRQARDPPGLATNQILACFKKPPWFVWRTPHWGGQCSQ